MIRALMIAAASAAIASVLAVYGELYVRLGVDGPREATSARYSWAPLVVDRGWTEPDMEWHSFVGRGVRVAPPYSALAICRPVWVHAIRIADDFKSFTTRSDVQAEQTWACTAPFDSGGIVMGNHRDDWPVVEYEPSCLLKSKPCVPTGSRVVRMKKDGSFDEGRVVVAADGRRTVTWP